MARKTTTLRLSVEEIATIDAARGPVAREAFIRAAALRAAGASPVSPLLPPSTANLDPSQPVPSEIAGVVPPSEENGEPRFGRHGCPECAGTGWKDEDVACAACEGSGVVVEERGSV